MEDSHIEEFGQFTMKTVVVPTYSTLENPPPVSEVLAGHSVSMTGQTVGTEEDDTLEAKDVYFICSHCTRCFDNKKSLMRHLDMHRDITEPKGEIINTKSRVMECKKCRIVFHSFADLEFHMNMKHASDTESADYKHAAKDALRMVEGADGKLPCPVCNKMLASRGNLQKHMFLHSGVKPWSCDVCGKLFSLKGNRDKHALIHDGVRKFECQVCNKKFALKGNLHQHILTHTETKFFRCEYCGNEFTLKGNLDKHIRRHFEKAKNTNRRADKHVLVVKRENENAANQICEIEPVIEEVAEHVEIQNDSSRDNNVLYSECSYASDNLNILGECATVVLSKSDPRSGGTQVSQLLISGNSSDCGSMSGKSDTAILTVGPERNVSVVKLDGTESMSSACGVGTRDTVVPTRTEGQSGKVVLIVRKGQESIDQRRITQMLDARMELCKQ